MPGELEERADAHHLRAATDETPQLLATQEFHQDEPGAVFGLAVLHEFHDVPGALEHGQDLGLALESAQIAFGFAGILVEELLAQDLEREGAIGVQWADFIDDRHPPDADLPEHFEAAVEDCAFFELAHRIAGNSGVVILSKAARDQRKDGTRGPESEQTREGAARGASRVLDSPKSSLHAFVRRHMGL